MGYGFIEWYIECPFREKLLKQTHDVVIGTVRFKFIDLETMICGNKGFGQIAENQIHGITTIHDFRDLFFNRKQNRKTWYYRQRPYYNLKIAFVFCMWHIIECFEIYSRVLHATPHLSIWIRLSFFLWTKVLFAFFENKFINYFGRGTIQSFQINVWCVEVADNKAFSIELTKICCEHSFVLGLIILGVFGRPWESKSSSFRVWFCKWSYQCIQYSNQRAAQTWRGFAT